MRKSTLYLGAGVLGAALLLPGLATAGHYGHGSVVTIIHGSPYSYGGPPAYAYRPTPYHHKHAYSKHRYKGHRHPVRTYHAPVYHAPVHRPPPVLYHAPAQSTVDFTIRYRTRF